MSSRCRITCALSHARFLESSKEAIFEERELAFRKEIYCCFQYISLTRARPLCSDPQQYRLASEPDVDLHGVTTGNAARRHGRDAVPTTAAATTAGQPRQPVAVDRHPLARGRAPTNSKSRRPTTHAAAQRGQRRNGHACSLPPTPTQFAATGKLLFVNGQ